MNICQSFVVVTCISNNPYGSFLRDLALSKEEKTMSILQDPIIKENTSLWLKVKTIKLQR